jgi:hypothetical protein
MNAIVISQEDNDEVMNYIKESVRFELGGPMVDVEISDAVIESLTKRALIIMAKYSLVTAWHTVSIVRMITGGQISYAKEVDTSVFPLEISYITDVIKSRGSNDVLTNTSDISGIPLGWAVRSGRSSMSNYTDTISNVATMYNERILAARLSGAFKDSCTWDYDKLRRKIYIDVGYPASSNITFEYVPLLTKDQVGLLKNLPEAYDFLTQYVVALSMQALGRARGKYTTSQYDWSISSTELITSGQAKIDKLMEMVNTSYSRAMGE